MKPLQNRERRIRPGSSPERRRQLRRDQTDAERLLWHHLRSRFFQGFKFRRQHAVGPYVLDFYCPDAQLGVELDGGQHLEPDQALHDEERRRYLEERGIRVLRFWDNDVLTSTMSVLESLRMALTLPSPTDVGEGPGDSDRTT